MELIMHAKHFSVYRPLNSVPSLIDPLFISCPQNHYNIMML